MNYFRVSSAFLMIFAIMLLTGCVKKQKKESGSNDFRDTVANAAQISDTTDLFDEFYKDEKVPTETKAAKKVVSPKNEASSTTSSYENFSSDGNYVVQISCVKAGSLADKLVKTLKAKGYPAYSTTVESPTPMLSGTYYRVRVGGFDAISSARQFAEANLVGAGYEYWIDNKANDNVGIEGSGLGSSGYNSNNSSSSTGSAWTSSTATPSAIEPTPAPAAATNSASTSESAWSAPASSTGNATPVNPSPPAATTNSSTSAGTQTATQNPQSTNGWGSSNSGWGSTDTASSSNGWGNSTPSTTTTTPSTSGTTETGGW